MTDLIERSTAKVAALDRTPSDASSPSPLTRIVYAWNYVEWGGAQVHILALIKEVRKRFDVTVLLPRGSNQQFLGFLDDLSVKYQLFEPATDLDAATTLRRKLQRHLHKRESELAMLAELEKFRTANTIFHVDLSPQQSLSALKKLVSNSHVFITLHNALPPVPAWREKLWKYKFRSISSAKTFHMFCSNEDSKRYFSNYVLPDCVQRIRVTYTSVNPPEIDAALGREFDKSCVLTSHGLKTNRFTVLAVGQFIDRKGRWVFLDAAKAVLKQHPEFQFVWLTPVMPDVAAQEKIDRMGLGDSFKIVLSEKVGRERDKILEFFRVADVFALPSFVEGLPIALLEAMALGIPSISTRINGIPEAVKDRETGLLIEPGDSSGLERAILSLYSDPDLRRRLATAGRQYVLEHFDERIAARTAIEAYKEAFAGE